MWQHNYEPIAGSLGLSALVAAIPILVLFVMLGAVDALSFLVVGSSIGTTERYARAVANRPGPTRRSGGRGV